MTAKLPLPAKLKTLVALGLAGLALAACGHMRPDSRYHYFQPSANQIGPHPNSYGEAVIPRHSLIAVQGDDFAYGLARGRTRWRINGAEESQSAITISQTLRKVVKGVRVENRGFPGDTAIRSAVRWEAAEPPNLLILCLGYGDLQAHTPPADFSVAMRGLITEAQSHGASVFVVLPPLFLVKDRPFVNNQLSLYRALAGIVARQTGAEVFDAQDSIARIKATAMKTVAQRAAVYQAVGADLVPYIKVVDAPPEPQTGQAGSGDSATVRASPASAS